MVGSFAGWRDVEVARCLWAIWLVTLKIPKSWWCIFTLEHWLRLCAYLLLSIEIIRSMMMISFDVYHNIQSPTTSLCFFPLGMTQAFECVYGEIDLFFRQSCTVSRTWVDWRGLCRPANETRKHLFFSRRNCTSLQSKDCLSFVHMPRLGVHGKKTNTQFNLEMYCSLAMLSIGYSNLGAPAVPHRIA